MHTHRNIWLTAKRRCEDLLSKRCRADHEEGLGYDDREISGLDTDTVVQRAAQFCQVKDQEKSEHQEGFTTGNGDRR